MCREGFETEDERGKKEEKKKWQLVQNPIFFCHTCCPIMEATP
jgi:hypothetical protein